MLPVNVLIDYFFGRFFSLKTSEDEHRVEEHFVWRIYGASGQGYVTGRSPVLPMWETIDPYVIGRLGMDIRNR
jgi:hypothetical protein